MAGLPDFIEMQPKWLILVIGLILVALIGVIDYLTGDYSLLIFYLIPVSFVSWFAGRRGAAAAVASGCARFISDYSLSGTTSHLYWNSLQDTIFLLVVAFLVTLLRKTLDPDRTA